MKTTFVESSKRSTIKASDLQIGQIGRTDSASIIRLDYTTWLYCADSKVVTFTARQSGVDYQVVPASAGSALTITSEV